MANNTASNSIALRIAGTKQRQAGFAPLATVGVLAGNEGANMDRVLMVPEKPSFLIKHTEDYILYMLMDRRVKSFDADASGVLSIALTIGRAVCLSGGKSPYDLLMEVYDTFRTRYMVPVSDGRDAFQNVDIDSEVFREIVGRYPLEACERPYVRMNPGTLSGIVCVPREQLSDFFRDTQYPEFASYRDIEIGSECLAMVSPGLDQLRIPRPVSYRVHVNGRPTGQSLNLPSDVCRASAPSSPMEEYEPVDFTLGELLSAPAGVLEKGGAVIRLKKAEEAIYCQLQHQDVKYAVYTSISGFDERDRNEVKQAFIDGQIRIQLDGRDITDELTRKTPMRPQDVVGHRLSIFGGSSRYLLSINTTPEHAEKKIKFTIGVSRKVVAPPPAAAKQPIQQSYSEHAAPSQPAPVRFHGKSFLIGLLSGLLAGAIAIALMLMLGGKKAKESVDEQKEPVANVAGQSTVTEGDKTGENANVIEEGTPGQEGNTVNPDDPADIPSDPSVISSEAKESNPEEEVASQKADEEAKKAEEERQKAEEKAKEARQAAVNWWNQDKCQSSFAVFQKTDEYKNLSRDDQCALDEVFRFSRYKTMYQYRVGTPDKVKEMVKDRLPLKDWNAFLMLQKEVQNFVKERKTK